MKKHLSFNEFIVYEELSFSELNRDNKQKIDLSLVNFAYHWLGIKQLFNSCYYGNNAFDYILKENKIRDLPLINFILSKDSEILKYKELTNKFICLTVDPGYEDPGFVETGTRLVFDFKKIIKHNKIIEDLTDNGEAEIRIKSLNDWNKYLIRIDIDKNSFYGKPEEFDDSEFKPVSTWFPNEISDKLNIWDERERNKYFNKFY